MSDLATDCIGPDPAVVRAVSYCWIDETPPADLRPLLAAVVALGLLWVMLFMNDLRRGRWP